MKRHKLTRTFVHCFRLTELESEFNEFVCAANHSVRTLPSHTSPWVEGAEIVCFWWRYTSGPRIPLGKGHASHTIKSDYLQISHTQLHVFNTKEGWTLSSNPPLWVFSHFFCVCFV